MVSTTTTPLPVVTKPSELWQPSQPVNVTLRPPPTTPLPEDERELFRILGVPWPDSPTVSSSPPPSKLSPKAKIFSPVKVGKVKKAGLNLQAPIFVPASSAPPPTPITRVRADIDETEVAELFRLLATIRMDDIVL